MPWLRVQDDYPTHPKTLHLKHLLDFDEADIFPIRLWAWAIRHAPEGDLSRFPDAVIESACGYRAEESDENFVLSLIRAGFLDSTDADGTAADRRTNEGRLSIHDWKDHSGLYEVLTRQGRARAKKFRDRASGALHNADITPESRVINAKNTHPELELELEIEKNKIKTLDHSTSDRIDATPNKAIGLAFAEFWKAYPRKKGKGAAQKAFQKALRACLNPESVRDFLGLILQAVARDARSRQWVDSMRDTDDPMSKIPHPATWINQRRWEDEADAPVRPANDRPPVSSGESQAVAAAAQAFNFLRRELIDREGDPDLRRVPAPFGDLLRGAVEGLGLSWSQVRAGLGTDLEGSIVRAVADGLRRAGKGGA